METKNMREYLQKKIESYKQIMIASMCFIILFVILFIYAVNKEVYIVSFIAACLLIIDIIVIKEYYTLNAAYKRMLQELNMSIENIKNIKPNKELNEEIKNSYNLMEDIINESQRKD